MTVVELIEQLKQFNPDLPISARIANRPWCFEFIATPFVVNDPAGKLWLQMLIQRTDAFGNPLSITLVDPDRL